MKLNRGKLAVISLSLNAIFILFFAGKRFYYAHSADPATKQFIITEKDIVFVGNSITERFPIQSYWKSNVINAGISGNTTAQILERISAIAKCHPSRILLEGGINDIHVKVPLDSIVLNYQLIIDSIRFYSPHTSIILQSVFPVALQYTRYQDKVLELNVRLSQLAEAKHIQFVDILTPLGGKEGLDTSFTIDGVHLNDKGYKVWEKTIDSLIN